VKQAPSVSAMFTLKAVPGPRLKIVIEKLTFWPGNAEFVLKSLET
jgi:hypothetical protein